MKFAFILAAMLSFSSLALADGAEPLTGSAALLCKMSRYALVTTETLSLDYDQKSVNGIPATFSEAMITWTIRNGGQIEHHELNRLTGIYGYWTEGKTSAEPMPTFVCVKEPEKF